MCIRYHRVDEKEVRLAQRMGVWYEESKPVIADGSLFPGSIGTVIRPGTEHTLELINAKWGLQPFWAKAPKWGQLNAYNARSETITEKPTFRSAYKKQRCVIVADAFYERANQRWLRVMPTHDEVFVFAGLWEQPNQWTDGLATYTLVTTEPNLAVAEVHDRMPVVLEGADIGAWLNPASDPKELLAVLRPCPAEWITMEDAGPTTRKAKIEE